MRLYIIISRRQREFGDRVARMLRDFGHEVFVPHEHPQLEDGETPQNIFLRNFEAIKSADTVVALFGKYYSKNFTTEVGMAFGQWKYIVGVPEADREDLMAYYAVSVWSTVEALHQTIRGPLSTRSLGA